MAQEEVYNYLIKGWYTTKELANKLKLTNSSVNRNICRIKKYSNVLIKKKFIDKHVTYYYHIE